MHITRDVEVSSEVDGDDNGDFASEKDLTNNSE